MRQWKGIILAGGSGTRLAPLTLSVSKQLLPVYDKPMIYYPLSVIINCGIRDIAIITTVQQQNLFKELLGNGSQLGCHFEYVVQEKPEGLAQAFLLTKDFIKGHNICFILGDNIFYGSGLNHLCRNAMQRQSGATVFGYRVKNPSRYGVIEFDPSGAAVSIEEKPSSPKSSFVVPGLYFYDEEVIEVAQSIRPSARGELEITDINEAYLKKGLLKVEVIERGVAWLDAGTFESLLEASSFIHTVQERQGLMIGSPEEAAWNRGFISNEQLRKIAEPLKNNEYGQYLLKLTERTHGYY